MPKALIPKMKEVARRSRPLRRVSTWAVVASVAMAGLLVAQRY